MKNLFKLLVAFLIFFSGLQAQAQEVELKVTGDANKVAKIESTRTTPRAIEIGMNDEINSVRMNPKGYIKHVKDYCKEWGNPSIDHPDVQALIKRLEEMTPITTKLKYSDCIYLAARDHSVNQAPTGDPEHECKVTNTKPWDRVKKACGQTWEGNENLASFAGYPMPGNSARIINIQLLIDKGLGPKYGHRENILEPKWTHTASFFFKYIGTGATMSDKMSGYHWVQKFGQAPAEYKDPKSSGTLPAPVITTPAPTNSTASTGGSSNNNNSTSSTPNCNCAGLPYTGSGTDFDGKAYYFCSDGNGKKSDISKACYDSRQ